MLLQHRAARVLGDDKLLIKLTDAAAGAASQAVEWLMRVSQVTNWHAWGQEGMLAAWIHSIGTEAPDHVSTEYLASFLLTVTSAATRVAVGNIFIKEHCGATELDTKRAAAAVLLACAV